MLTRPASLLRIEELCLFVACLFLYAHLHFSWILFAVLFLTPDLFMLGYFAGPSTGAAAYNIGHFLLLPLALFTVGLLAGRSMLMAIGLIWFSHIAFDRALSYGFKYPTFFKDTHLLRLG